LENQSTEQSASAIAANLLLGRRKMGRSLDEQISDLGIAIYKKWLSHYLSMESLVKPADEAPAE
jgi:hypothetical protein